MLNERLESTIKNRLERMDFDPWHTIYGLRVWRLGLKEWRFAIDERYVSTQYSINNATAFVLTTGRNSTRR